MDFGDALAKDVANAKVLVEIAAREKITGVNFSVSSVEAVDAAETLDEADGVPVQVVVYEVGSVLKIETFGEDVGGDEDINGRTLFSRGGVVGDGSEAFDDAFEVAVTAVCRFNTAPVGGLGATR